METKTPTECYAAVCDPVAVVNDWQTKLDKFGWRAIQTPNAKDSSCITDQL